KKPRSRSRSSARRSTWAPAGEASTWGRPRSATRVSMPASSDRAGRSTTGATSRPRLRRQAPSATSGSASCPRSRRPATGSRSSWGAQSTRSTWRSPAVDAGRVALVGVRELDEGERELLGSLHARVYTMSDVDRLGVERVMRESLSHVAGAPFVHLSLDMDVLDPEVAPGVGTPVRGGLSYREAHLAMELVAESGLVGSIEVVEVNPILDRENETAKLAVELVASALGARIL